MKMEWFCLKRGFKRTTWIPSVSATVKTSHALISLYKTVHIISFFFMGLLYGTHMWPIWATRIWALPIWDPCGARVHSPYESHMGSPYGTHIGMFAGINKNVALDSRLADCQHGFRSQRSCETQLVQFVHDIISNLDGAVNRGHTEQTDLIIMDFAKAFDKVPHRRLLHKLEYYGIRGSTRKWIYSWLSMRTQQVVLDGQASDRATVLCGVPQGSFL